jgi:hypothetical protein
MSRRAGAGAFDPTLGGEGVRVEGGAGRGDAVGGDEQAVGEADDLGRLVRGDAVDSEDFQPGGGLAGEAVADLFEFEAGVEF